MAIDVNYIPILTAVTGIIAGAILNSGIAWIKTWRDNNRIRNEATYYLLEFRFLLSRSDFNKTYPRIIRSLFESLPTNIQSMTSQSDLELQLKPSIYPLWGKLTNTTSRRYNELGNNFKKIVSKLSSIDPQQAYILSGKEDVISNLSQIEESLISVQKSNSTIENSTVDNFSQTLNTNTIENSIKAIEELLLVLQKRIFRPFAKKRNHEMLLRFDITYKLDKDEIKKILTPILNKLQEISATVDVNTNNQ